MAQQVPKRVVLGGLGNLSQSNVDRQPAGKPRAVNPSTPLVLSSAAAESSLLTWVNTVGKARSATSVAQTTPPATSSANAQGAASAPAALLQATAAAVAVDENELAADSSESAALAADDHDASAATQPAVPPSVDAASELEPAEAAAAAAVAPAIELCAQIVAAFSMKDKGERLLLLNQKLLRAKFASREDLEKCREAVMRSWVAELKDEREAVAMAPERLPNGQQGKLAGYDYAQNLPVRSRVKSRFAKTWERIVERVYEDQVSPADTAALHARYTRAAEQLNLAQAELEEENHGACVAHLEDWERGLRHPELNEKAVADLRAAVGMGDADDLQAPLAAAITRFTAMALQLGRKRKARLERLLRAALKESKAKRGSSDGGVHPALDAWLASFTAQEAAASPALAAAHKLAAAAAAPDGPSASNQWALLAAALEKLLPKNAQKVNKELEALRQGAPPSPEQDSGDEDEEVPLARAGAGRSRLQQLSRGAQRVRLVVAGEEDAASSGGTGPGEGAASSSLEGGVEPQDGSSDVVGRKRKGLSELPIPRLERMLEEARNKAKHWKGRIAEMNAALSVARKREGSSEEEVEAAASPSELPGAARHSDSDSSDSDSDSSSASSSSSSSSSESEASSE